MGKRLFIFAAYDPDNIIDESLLWYINALSGLGDVIFVMDNDTVDTSKLKRIKNLLYFENKNHGEYDFGSYKRGYMWARDKKILGKYDWVYLVNDSVYGPLFDLEPCLKEMESRGTDFVGLTSNYDEKVPVHIQSWFVGLSHNIAASDVLYKFMQDVKPRESKREIVYKYEIGLSRCLLQAGFTMSALFAGQKSCDVVYDKPIEILENLIPFVKKSALGNVGSKIYLLPYTSDEFIKQVYDNADRVGIKYVDTVRPIKIFRLSLFFIPMCTVQKIKDMSSKQISYRVYLFDKIRVLKITRHKG